MIKLIAIFSALLVVPFGQTTFAAEIEACGPALINLIGLVEDRGQLAEANTIDISELDLEQFSICHAVELVKNQEPSIKYELYRSTDNVTIIIGKREVASGQLSLYGPFFSAYRK